MTEDAMTIGRFARLTGLTAKALRHYDAISVLRPACVDRDTGYRSYSAEQMRAGRLVRRLRDLDVPLDAVRGLLEARADGDAYRARSLIAVHLRNVDAARSDSSGWRIAFG